tara:strand:- start:531 stop:827 length:297 start_codon:yes stop_codon:yes gene_type:complete
MIKKQRPTKKYPHYVDCTSKRSFIGDINEHALFADGLDEAIIGYDSLNFCVVYDYSKCLEVLMESESMTYPQAHEHMEFNITSAYVGDFTPMFIHSLI